MNEYHFNIAFRARHPHLDPDEIARVLGLVATFKHRSGAQRQTPTGTPLEGTYKETYCCFDMKLTEGLLLADALMECNSRLRPHKEFLASLVKTGGRLDYFVGWYVAGISGETFPVRLLSELAELQIDLGLDVYRSDSQQATPHGTG